MQGQGGGAPMWSVAVHCACGDWGFPGGAGQGQSPPVFAWGPLSELHSNLRWLLLVLGLEIPRRSQAVNLGQLLLVPGLGLTEASCFLFERILGSCEARAKTSHLYEEAA